MTDKEQEEFEKGCQEMLIRLKSKDPLFELNMEFGKMLMKNNKIEKDLINASKRLEKIEERKNIIRSIQNIDYSKSGWGLKLSKILGISSQRTVKFVQYHMLDELNPKFNNI